MLPNLTNSQEPEPGGAGCFWLLGAGAARKKIPRAGAAKTFAGSPALIKTIQNGIHK